MGEIIWVDFKVRDKSQKNQQSEDYFVSRNTIDDDSEWTDIISKSFKKLLKESGFFTDFLNDDSP